MSHITKIKAEIKDLTVLKEAAEKIGLVLHENQKTFKSYNNGHCDHALSVKNSTRNTYEIGLVKNGDIYEMRWDTWSGGYGLVDAVGNNCEKLINEYAKNVALKEARNFATKYGYSLVQEFDSNTNETVLKLRRY